MAIFKNIYHEPWKNKIHLWELEDNGKTVYKTFDHDIEYYTIDKTGQSPIKSIYGESVVKRVSKNKNDLKELKESGEKIFESDLDECVKFLHKRYGDTQTKINYDDYVIANFDIEIQTEGEFPKPELALYPVNLITVQLMRTKEIFTFGLYEYAGENKDVVYIHCKTEEELLNNFCKFLKYKKVDIFVTWNGTGKAGKAGKSGGFDIPYLVNRIERINLKCSLSPINKTIRKNNGDIEIVGVSDLDLMELYRKFTYTNQPSYSLNYIGELEVGETKLTYDGEISDLWKRDPIKFIDYNIQDVLLVSKIEAKKKLVELAINFSNMTRTPLSKVYSTVAIVEGYLLRYLHKENLVMSDRNPYTSDEKIKGGYVEAHPGFYYKLFAIDGTSLYPSILRQFNISPETKVLNPISTEGLIKTRIKGLYYKKTQGIIPKVVTEIFNTRKMLKEKMAEYELNGNTELAEYYDSQQLIYKILSNSVYGAFLEKSFHYFDIDNGSCITSIGRDVIKYVASKSNEFLNIEFPKIAKEYYKNFVNKITNSNKVCVIDTDSNYICIEEIYNSCNTNESFLNFCLHFESIIFEPFLKKIMIEYSQKYNTECLLHFKREKIILKQYVEAKKNYMTYIVANEKKIYETPTLKLTGGSIVKSDLAKYSKTNLKKLGEMMFEGDKPNKDNMVQFIRKSHKEYKKLTINDIATPKGLGDYEKYEVELDDTLDNFVTKTPIHNRASIVYNKVIHDRKLPYMEINSGTKMKYIYVQPNNNYKTDVIGFIGNWPKEFNDIFEIDLEKQFEKQYLRIAQRMFDTLGFGKITLKDSKLSKLVID